MNLDFIKTTFENREPMPEGFKNLSAVLVPFVEIDNKPHLLLTQRALHMFHQPGDFCFPGGRVEKGETFLETAIRETEEELGIKEENIEIFGQGDLIISPFGIYIVPFLGRIKNFNEEELVLNKDEVEKVILVPFDFFKNFNVHQTVVSLEPKFPEDFPFHLIVGGKNYKWGNSESKQFFFDYNGDIIWGLTARIINNIKEILIQSI